ncbi:MAG TPA: YfhO family protein [Longimicrobium sp.]|nr:YfhO family protein [Longimicrobium sp.]
MKKTPPAAAPARRPSAFAAAPAEAEPGMGTGTAAAIYFGLALLYFLPAFLPGRHIFGTDYIQSSYFYLDFISQRTAAGELPGWVPYVYGGVPLFSNPGSTYYPLRWVADLLGPTRIFFPLLFVFQFGMAGVGMFLLGRELGCRRWVAFVAGLAFQWTGILTSWVYAGHDGRIIVVTFAPLFFWAIHAGVRTGAFRYFAALAATSSLVLLSFQIQNAYYLLLSGAIWAVFCLATLARGDSKRLVKAAALGAAAVAFGFVAAAVNFLPFQDYVGQSPRGQTEGRGWEYSTSYSMPVRAVLGVAVPEQVGATIQNDRGEYVFPIYRGENAFRLHTEYVGATVLVLVALGLWYARRNRYWWFFAGLGFFALTLALGGNTPLYRLYYEILPGVKRFRAPDLAYYVLAFSLIVGAALALERLAALREASRAAGARRGATAAREDDPGMVKWIVVGVVVISVLGAMAVGTPSAGMAEGTVGLSPAAGWMRFTVFAALAGAAVWMWMEGRIASRAAMIALAVITTADLWVIGKKFFQTVPAPDELYAADDVMAFFEQQRARGEPFRIWMLGREAGWPRFINHPMHFGLEQAGGEHGNQLQRYNEYAGAGERTYVDYHNFNDGRFLAGANIRYLVAPGELAVPWLREAYRGASAIVYENLSAQPRAWLVPQVTRMTDPSQTLAFLLSEAWNPAQNAVVEAPADLGLPNTPLQGGARVTSHAPDAVTVVAEASRPALLVLADNYYKDWKATVDGRPVEIHRTNHTFRGVVVPAGRHEVRFTFESSQLRTGFWIYLACMALLAAAGLFFLLAHFRRRRAAPPSPDAPVVEG